ncbi:MAG: trigger factor [Deltaproteobacteria bacterium]|nr:trigger factor [Deltaproteobacteria bacterium]
MSTIEEVSSTKRKLSVEISAEETKPHFNQAVEQCAKNAKFNGFRPGKIPRSVLIKQFDAQIRKQIVESLVTSRIYKEIEAHGLYSVNNPTIESLSITEGRPLTCVASFEVLPTFELPNYSGLEVPKRKVSEEDVNVERRLKEIQDKFATISALEENRPVQEGDIVDVSYQIFHKRKPVVLKKEEITIFSFVVGEFSEYYQELQDAIPGMLRGEVKEVDLTMPLTTNYPKISGQPVTFQIKLNNIRVKEVPPIDDELAQSTGYPNVTDLASLRSHIVQQEIAGLEKESVQNSRLLMLDLIAQQLDIELPESLLSYETSLLIDNYRNKLLSYYNNQPVDQLITDSYRERCGLQARRDILHDLIIDKVRTQTNLTVTDDDIDREIAYQAYVTGQPLDQIRQIVKDDKDFQYFKNRVLTEKILNYMYSQVKVVEVANLDPLDYLEPKAENLPADHPPADNPQAE